LLTNDDKAEAQIPLPDPSNDVGHVQDDVDEPLEDDDRLYENGTTALMYSSPYSSFLLPLLSPVSFTVIGNSGGGRRSSSALTYDQFYKLVSGFEVSSVADLQLRHMAKNMFPREAAAVDETCQEFLNFYGETPGVPCTGYLGFCIVRYCHALKLSEEQPRYRAVAEVFYSTSTSEAPCERVIGDVRAMIGDSRYNLGLKTLSAMLAMKNKFDTSSLVLKLLSLSFFFLLSFENHFTSFHLKFIRLPQK
jgi:hypothetical protein